MKTLKLAVTLTALACAAIAINVPAATDAQGIEWDTLNQEVMSLYEKGQYERAVVVAKKALAVAEEDAGPDHPSVATSLNNLAGMYRDMGRVQEAGKLEARAAQIEAIER